MIRPSSAALLLAACALVLTAVPAHAETRLSCASTTTDSDDGTPGTTTSTACSVGDTVVSAPATPADRPVFRALVTTYDTLVAAGVCPAEGPCVENDEAGVYLAKNESKESPRRHELKGHVTLMK